MTAGRVTFGLASLTLAATLLSGCSTSLTPPAAAPRASVTPTSSPTPTFVPTPCASAPTTVETDAAEAAGLKVYPLDHGGLIFDPTQPLPDCITVTIAERVKQAVADADGGATAELALSVKEAARSASRHSERTVVIIYGFIGATRENPIYLRYFGAREGGEDHGLGRASLSTSLDETIAKTQAWIAGQPDAASWDIVVAADA